MSESLLPPQPINRRVLISVLDDPRFFSPSLGDALLKLNEETPDAPPVLSGDEYAARQAEHYRQVARGYALTQMLRKNGIRRSVTRSCPTCGKTISANKAHCAAHQTP